MGLSFFNRIWECLKHFQYFEINFFLKLTCIYILFFFQTLSPAMSIVLRLITADMVPDAVKWILNSGYKEANLERALLNLCLWLTKWTYTPNLSPLVVLFMEVNWQWIFSKFSLNFSYYYTFENMFFLTYHNFRRYW